MRPLLWACAACQTYNAGWRDACLACARARTHGAKVREAPRAAETWSALRLLLEVNFEQSGRIAYGDHHGTLADALSRMTGAMEYLAKLGELGGVAREQHVELEALRREMPALREMAAGLRQTLEDLVPTENEHPSPGRLFVVCAGDSLHGENGLVNRAYGRGGRLTRGELVGCAHLIAYHPFNLRFHRPTPDGGAELCLRPVFGPPAVQLVDRRGGEGEHYPGLFIPRGP